VSLVSRPHTQLKQVAEVCIGKAGTLVGQLSFVKQGQRENATFAYDPAWLSRAETFNVSPDLSLIVGHQPRRAVSRSDSVFHAALADTAPDAWGRRVIARAHAKARKQDPRLSALTEFDYLAAVDDFARRHRCLSLNACTRQAVLLS